MVSAAYIAGFFDGEGCVGLYSTGRNKTFNLRVQIVQNVTVRSKRLFRYLQDTYGGTWSRRKRKKAANWQLHGDNATRFLRDIQTHSVLKGDQIDLALRWAAQHPQPMRGANGRRLPYQGDRAGDQVVARQLKQMKRR
jgi:hypothetical protein